MLSHRCLFMNGLRQIRCSYTNWTYGSAQQCDDFFSDRATIQLYKNHVRNVLTRVNTLTGLAYGADPTIFGAALWSRVQGLGSCRCPYATRACCQNSLHASKVPASTTCAPAAAKAALACLQQEGSSNPCKTVAYLDMRARTIKSARLLAGAAAPLQQPACSP